MTFKQRLLLTVISSALAFVISRLNMGQLAKTIAEELEKQGLSQNIVRGFNRG
jgi:hypothetical protein